MKENYMVCNCKQVSYFTIADAIHSHTKFEDVLEIFEDVKKTTNCSTGCGGCHDKVLGIISDIIMGNEQA